MKDLSQRYWVFLHDNYYPLGGIEDLKGTFQTLEAARIFACDSLGSIKLGRGEYDDGHILDTKSFGVYTIEDETGFLITSTKEFLSK
jgi:hypothetical protein